MTKEMLEGFGMSSDLIALSMDEASKKSNFSLSTIAMQYVGNLIFFSLIGLVTSLILKRDKIPFDKKIIDIPKPKTETEALEWNKP